MSEVKKAGRPPMNKESRPSNPKFFEEPATDEQVSVVEAPCAVRDSRYSGVCRRFMIHKVPSCSDWAYAAPGTLTPVHIQRGKVVVLPEEYFEAFKSAGVEMLKCDMDFPAGGNPSYYTEYITNYPYQDLGEVSWDDYLAWKAEDAKKVHPNYVKKR